MNISPFNVLYGGIDLPSLFKEIKDINNIYDFYFKLTKTNGKGAISPAYSYDVDDNTFGLKDAFGRELTSIEGYYIGETYIDQKTTFPIKKTDDEFLYTTDICYVKESSELDWFKYFKETFKYKAFDSRFNQRLEYLLNLLNNALLSPLDGTVKAIDKDTVTITDKDGNDHSVDRIGGILNVVLNEAVKQNQIIEKSVSVDMVDGKILITKKSDAVVFNGLVPLKGFVSIKNI